MGLKKEIVLTVDPPPHKIPTPSGAVAPPGSSSAFWWVGRIPCSNFVTDFLGRNAKQNLENFRKCPGKGIAFCLDNLQGDTSGRIVGMGWVDFDL